jgi:hypothetical protein
MKGIDQTTWENRDGSPEMLVVAQDGVQFRALVNFVMNPLGASKLCRVEMFGKRTNQNYAYKKEVVS